MMVETTVLFFVFFMLFRSHLLGHIWMPWLHKGFTRSFNFYSIMFAAENHNSLIIAQYTRTRGEGDRRICSRSVANLLCDKHEKSDVCSLSHTHMLEAKHTHIITTVNLAVIKGVWLGILINPFSIIYESRLNGCDLSSGPADEVVLHSWVFIVGAGKEKDVRGGGC